MTIYLSHSPAAAYDLLAQAVIRVREQSTDNEAKAELMELDAQIQGQVGTLLHEQVCASPEYVELLVCHEQGVPVQALPRALEERWFKPTGTRL